MKINEGRIIPIIKEDVEELYLTDAPYAIAVICFKTASNVEDFITEVKSYGYSIEKQQDCNTGEHEPFLKLHFNK